MPLEKAENVIEQCVEMCRHMNRLPYFYITGGDPILHRNFWEILALLKERDIPFTILGNPFHITNDVCKRLKSMGCEKYQLSIDGMKNIHDSIRKPSSFDTTIEKIDVLRRNGIRVAIMTTVSGTNINEIPDIIDLVVKKGVEVFAFGRYCPTSEEKSTHISPMEYRDFLERIWEKFEQHKDSGTIFNLKDHLWILFLYEKGLFNIDATVVATTRNIKKAAILKEYGSDDVILEGDGFKERFLEKYPKGAGKVLELIGAATLKESLKITKLHGIVCHTGLLGGVYGLKNFDPIKEIPSGVYLTGFYSNYPTQSQITDMMNLIERGNIHPIIANKFTIEEIADAHLLAEKRGQIGKIVVTV